MNEIVLAIYDKMNVYLCSDCIDAIRAAVAVPAYFIHSELLVIVGKFMRIKNWQTFKNKTSKMYAQRAKAETHGREKKSRRSCFHRDRPAVYE